MVYTGIKGYVNNRVDEKTRRFNLDMAYDKLTYPYESDNDRIEGERRLNEYVSRLKKLKSLCDFRMELEDIALMQGTLGFPPATDSAIKAAEARLGVRFPPSYREFLAVSNGWLTGGSVRLLPVEELKWLTDLDPKYVKDWKEHELIHESALWPRTERLRGIGEGFANDLQDVDIPTRDLERMLVVGVNPDEPQYILLDPGVVTLGGEWRALDIFRYEGASVTEDFARMMEILYRDNARIEQP